MNAGSVEALEVTVTAPVVSFRNPLYAAEQLGLPCPPPATVGGMLAAAAGGWDHVSEDLVFAMGFHARGKGVDLETYHPLDATGRKADPVPRSREFLADVTLMVWLLDDPDRWERRLRRPVWPLRLGRSQDLATARTRRVLLSPGAGRQGSAVLPATTTTLGTLLRLPSSVSRDRSRTLWGAYRHHVAGERETLIEAGWLDDGGQAVGLLPPVHPVHAERGRPADA